MSMTRLSRQFVAPLSPRFGRSSLFWDLQCLAWACTQAAKCLHLYALHGLWVTLSLQSPNLSASTNQPADQTVNVVMGQLPPPGTKLRALPDKQTRPDTWCCSSSFQN